MQYISWASLPPLLTLDHDPTEFQQCLLWAIAHETLIYGWDNYTVEVARAWPHDEDVSGNFWLYI